MRAQSCCARQLLCASQSRTTQVEDAWLVYCLTQLVCFLHFDLCHCHLSPVSLDQNQIEKYKRNTAGHLLTLDPILLICNFQDTGFAQAISNVCHLQTRGWPTLWTGWTSWGCDLTAQDPPLFCSLRDQHNYLRRWEKAVLLSHVNSFAFKMCPNLKVKVKILGFGKIFKK